MMNWKGHGKEVVAAYFKKAHCPAIRLEKETKTKKTLSKISGL
jgi:hypothetical protein